MLRSLLVEFALRLVCILLYLLSIDTMGSLATFTPKDLLSEPRRSSAVPNPAGTIALFSSSTYSFETHSKTKKYHLLDIEKRTISTIFEQSNISEAHWLGVGDHIAYVVNSNDEVKGGSELWISVGDKKYKAASFPALISNLKFVKLNNRAVKFLFTTETYPDGTIYNPETAPKRYTSARVYTSIWVRHWDKYITPQKSAIFSGTLSANDHGEYIAASADFINLLKGSDLESPAPPFGGTDDFDISPDGSIVAFVAKDPDINPSTHTASYIYVVRVSGDGGPKPINKPEKKGDAAGASSYPIFSPDGTRVAFLQMDEDGYESDKRKIYIYDFKSDSIKSLVPSWDRSPAKIAWSRDGEYLYLIAEEYGREKVWLLSSNPSLHADPQILIEDGGTSDMYSLGKASSLSLDTLLLTSTTLASPTYYTLVEVKTRKMHTLLSPREVSTTGSGSLRESQIDEFWAPRSDGVRIHSWIVKPSFFNEKEKYPLALLIHGGPQGAWTNTWSTRWNPAVFAERGFIVVAVNPTGSTGYGQAFTDAIQDNWGGTPYDDLVLAFDHVIKNYAYIDGDRAVALGASYGGYMVNWIQGNPFGRKLKALVCHDGVFSTLNQYASEELYFPNHDFGGPIWSTAARKNYEKWDPARLTHNWATPQLVIHCDLDYRLPVSEGISAFNVLQSRGIPSKYLTFPDENHWVLNPENSLVWHEEVLGFIEYWVGLRRNGDGDGNTYDYHDYDDLSVKSKVMMTYEHQVPMKIGGEGREMMQEVFEKPEMDL